MCVCVVLYGAVEHWLSGALVNVGDDDDDDDAGNPRVNHTRTN